MGQAADGVLTEEKDKALFEVLRALRTEISREEKVPPYVVFSDKSLIHFIGTLLSVYTGAEVADVHFFFQWLFLMCFTALCDFLLHATVPVRMWLVKVLEKKNSR